MVQFPDPSTLFGPLTEAIGTPIFGVPMLSPGICR